MLKRSAYIIIVLCLAITSAYLLNAHGAFKGGAGGAPPAPAVNGSVPPGAGGAAQTPGIKAADNLIVPVLYYHAVNDKITGIRELFVSPQEFDRQMAFLRDSGYTVITFDQLDRATEYAKPIIITFDDGYEDNYYNAYPILKKYGFPATIFLISGYIDKPGYLKKSQVVAMSDLINFQGHTVTHPYLTQLGDRALEYELSESKRQLEAITGRSVTVLAYPIGDHDQRVLDVTRRFYRYAVLMGGGLYRLGDDPYLIKRVYVPRSLDIEGFERKINASPGASPPDRPNK